MKPLLCGAVNSAVRPRAKESTDVAIIHSGLPCSWPEEALKEEPCMGQPMTSVGGLWKTKSTFMIFMPRFCISWELTTNALPTGLEVATFDLPM